MEIQGMLSRARLFAAVTFLAACLAGQSAWAQATNLEAGKSASQLFAGTCTACHKSPRGLLKTVSPGSLPGFLREHYTTSGDMASQLSSYLISNGASDTRQSKQGADKPGADKQGQGGNDQADRQGDRQGRKNRNAPPQEAARPDDAAAPGEGGRQSRKHLGRQADPSDEARTPAQAAIERGPDGRRPKRSGSQPGADEPPTANEPGRMEPPKAESAKAEPGADAKAKPEASRGETGAAERAKPDADAKSNEVKIEAPQDAGVSDKPVARRDPAPAAMSTPSAAASTPAPGAASGGSSEPAAPQAAVAQPKAPVASEPPAVTASAPPPAPSSGPPAPPISR
jgi:hypothetical protein